MNNVLDWFKERRQKSLERMGKEIDNLKIKWHEMKDIENEIQEKKKKEPTVLTYVGKEVFGFLRIVGIGLLWGLLILLIYPTLITRKHYDKGKGRWTWDLDGCWMLGGFSWVIETTGWLLLTCSYDGGNPVLPLFYLFLVPSIRILQMIIAILYYRVQEAIQETTGR